MVDVEQVVIRNRLVLGVLLRGRTPPRPGSGPRWSGARPAGMEVEVTAGDADEARAAAAAVT